MEHEPSNYEYSDFVRGWKDKYEKLLLSGDIDRTIQIQDDFANFIQRLKEKHGPGELEKYALYHALTGTPHQKIDILADDLDGEDSISAFIERLEKDYPSV